MTDTKAIRKKLTALWIQHGHDSAIGRRYHNLLQLLDHWPRYEMPEGATHPCQHLPGLITLQLASLETLREARS